MKVITIRVISWVSRIYINVGIFIQAHFRKINDTSIALFESHIAEIVWRNWARTESTLLEHFIRLLKTYFPLDGPNQLSAPHPVFPSWYRRHEASADDTIHRNESDTETQDNVADDEIEEQGAYIL